MKTKLFLSLALGLLLSLGATAQSLRDHKWIISAGVGLGEAEATHGLGFASGAYVGYRAKGLEVGIGFRQIAKQTTGNSYRLGMGIDYTSGNLPRTMIHIYGHSPAEFTSGNSYAVNLAAGLDPLFFIKRNERHRLFVGILAGVGGTTKTFYYQSAPFYGTRVQSRGPFSWGGKLAYEYLLTRRVGLGLSLLYDHPLQSAHSLATLNVHF